MLTKMALNWSRQIAVAVAPKLPVVPLLRVSRRHIATHGVSRPLGSSNTVRYSSSSSLPAGWENLSHKEREAYADKFVKDLMAAEPLEGVEAEVDNKWGYFKPDAPWGMAVYRTCYDNEAKWQKMRKHLETTIRKELEDRSRHSILKRHQFVFMDDRSLFDGASPAKVRDHFDQWAKGELKRNMAQRPLSDDSHRSHEELMKLAGTRYHICMLIDDVCLQSVDVSQTALRELVMLVKKDSDLASESKVEQDIHPDYEDGWMVDHNEGPGGWIYVEALEYIKLYDMLSSDHNDWYEDHMFMYPSLVYGNMGLKRSPGFSRRENLRGAKANMQSIET